MYGILVLALIGFELLRRLSLRLQTPHPLAKPIRPLSAEVFDSISYYKNIDLRSNIPTNPTHAGYVVIGGSGFVGQYIVRLLLLRGESNIRIADLLPPPPEIHAHPCVTFVKTDITSMDQVRSALMERFPSTGKPAEVIYHVAANIRFWERLSYCLNASCRINVGGTQNILTVAKELPSALVVYTSTGDTAVPRPRFFRLGHDYHIGPGAKLAVSDDDSPLSEDQVSGGCYGRSKLRAEQLVTAANDGTCLKTGIVRPGYTILGPNDRLVAGSTLGFPRVPVWDKVWSLTAIGVWDVAAAHLLLEDALRTKPAEVGGQSFLVTGKGPAWTYDTVRKTVKMVSKKNVILDEVPPLLILTLAYTLEALLYVRYHILLPFYMVFGAQPTLAPRWLGEAVYLQPSTLDYLHDIEIDDSRARNILAYRPQWEIAHSIRYAVDEFESSGDKHHGLQMRS